MSIRLYANGKPLEQSLSEFVKEACANRPESHGWAHMKSVADTSNEILKINIRAHAAIITEDSTLPDTVMIAAWLHDVPDHKYSDGTVQQCREFLATLGFKKSYIELIMDIVARVSFSAEIKSQRKDWGEKLGSMGSVARNIVSDADKIHAIGNAGLVRCAAYVREKHPGISRKELKRRVTEHAGEKLSLLFHMFIRTVGGEEIAKPLHDEMMESLKDLDSLIFPAQKDDAVREPEGKKIKIQIVDDNAVMPAKAHPTDIGWDLTAIKLYKQMSAQTALYDTGIKVKPPPGYYIEIVGRSSISKTGYIVSNAVGIIDPSYTGNLLIALTRVDAVLAGPLEKSTNKIIAGVDVADLKMPFPRCQMILRRAEYAEIETVDSIEETERGDGGFGSTDR
jgi:deoxyuridine 5'-triphosphate nucleotidohydrolase